MALKALKKPEGWAGALAASLVSRKPLAPLAAQQLREAFEGADAVWLVLAQGTTEDGIEAYALQRDGAVTQGPLVPEPATCWQGVAAAGHGPSAVALCLQRQELMQVDERTPDRGQLADWRELHAAAGITWLLAAPLICSEHLHGRLLGALVVAGRGEGPSVDPQWLREFACELACNVAHASVQMMECSLEMLSVLFPPRVLEQLVGNAARRTGQTDLAEVLRSAVAPSPQQLLPGSGAGALSPATAPSSVRSSLEGRAAQLPPASPASSVRLSIGSAADPSPFAAAAAAMPPPGRASPGGALSPSAAALLRHASGGGSTASAVLRQMSLQSDVLHLFDDQQAAQQLSPHGWEVSGYEDLLEEDYQETLRRKPSLALDRAHSRPSPTPDQRIASATAAMEEAGGLPAAVQGAEAQVAEQSASAAAAAAAAVAAAADAAPAAEEGGSAAGPQPQLLFDKQHQSADDPVSSGSADGSGGGEAASSIPARAASLPAVRTAPPPAVHWPGQSKPLAYPLGNGKPAEHPYLSPRKPSTASSDAFGSTFGSGSGSLGHPDGSMSQPQPSASLPAPKQQGPSASSSLLAARSSSEGAKRCLTPAGPDAPEAPSAASSPAARMQWDLQFVAPILEAQRWVAPQLRRGDALLGLFHAADLATAVGAWAAWAAVPGSLLQLAAVLLPTLAAVPAVLRPGWWAARRTAVVLVLRLLAALLGAAYMAAYADPLAQEAGASWVESLLLDSGAASLFFLSLRLPLPFSAHLPVHLLCLWIATAGVSLQQLRRATEACAAGGSLGIQILAQAFVGFLLASLVAYLGEARLRRRFLKSRRAAACLGARQKHAGLPPTAPVAHGGGGGS